MKRSVVPVVVCLVVAACGGGSGGENPAPTSPTPPPVSSNVPPSITAMSMTTFGIQQLSQFSFSASATDPNGDALTYAWDLAGNAASGSSGTMFFSSGGGGTARVTVSDGKGGTATETRSFVVGSMSGTWQGVYPGYEFTSILTQNGSRVTGDYRDQLGEGGLDPDYAKTPSSSGTSAIWRVSGRSNCYPGC